MSEAGGASSLRVTEIFRSLQGETATAGVPTTFVRLTGCPLRCTYCDTPYAFHGGRRLSLEAVVAEVERLAAPWVTITGGEPLAQREACLALLERLCDRGFSVSLETGGALSIAGVDPRVRVVLDIKTPGSGEEARNRLDNLDLLKPEDEVKFVLVDRGDYQWARAFAAAHGLLARRERVLFSPAYGRLDPALLADWILEDGLPVRLQVQLHKLLWGDVPGR